jgi:hypothetical protein
MQEVRQVQRSRQQLVIAPDSVMHYLAQGREITILPIVYRAADSLIPHRRTQEELNVS